MEIDILKNHFETVYRDYKDYEAFIISIQDEVKKKREDFQERAVKGGESEDTLVSALFDLSIKPIQSEEDLRVLRNKLIAVYDAYKIVIDFPEDIKEEVNNLARPYQAYRIVNNTQVDIDPAKNDTFREEARRKHLEVVKALKEQ